MKYKFVSMVTGANPQGEILHDTFEGAWREMYQWVKALIDFGNMSYQVLETCIWIECIEDGHKTPLFFYDARDRACDEGIMDKIKAEENS